MPIEQKIHRDAALENVSITYQPGGFIAELLSPRLTVKHETDEYFVYGNDTLQLEETLNANESPANRVKFSMSTSTYVLKNHNLKDLVTDRSKKNADKAVKLEIDATEIITKKIMIRKEYDLAQMVQSSSNWSNNTSLTSTMAWTANTTSSNPITQIDSATSKILLSSGYFPNKLVLDWSTFVGAKEHTSIVDRVKYTSAKSVTKDVLATLFNINEVLVATSSYEGAEEGLTSDKSWIWTNCAWLGYVEKSPGLKKASAMYTFAQEGTPRKVTKWGSPDPVGTWIKVEEMYQHKAVATSCGYLIIDTA